MILLVSYHIEASREASNPSIFVIGRCSLALSNCEGVVITRTHVRTTHGLNITEGLESGAKEPRKCLNHGRGARLKGVVVVKRTFSMASLTYKLMYVQAFFGVYATLGGVRISRLVSGYQKHFL